MSLATVCTRAQAGIEAPPVTCEVQVTGGLPSLTIVGLVETAVKDFLKKTNIVTTDELKELKKEIRELKSIVNTMTTKGE